MRKFRSTENELLLDVCEAFLAKEDDTEAEGPRGERLKDRTIDQVRARVNAVWRERDVAMQISREEVYAAILEARYRDLFRISPPPHVELQRRLVERFKQGRDRLRVVATESRTPEHVATDAAKLIEELIQTVGSRKSRVGIGFGAGWTTRVVAYQLALSLQTASDLPPLTLHATSSGFGGDHTHTAPVTFFGFFEGVARDIKAVGMFGPPYVSDGEHDATVARRGVVEAFRQSPQIDIVVTSLACAHDPHSGLREVAREMGFDEQLDELGWAGDVQHLPYSETAPITGFGHLPVTLFDLEGLHRMARRSHKHVVLVSPPCPGCGRTRARALLPLLTRRKLKIWTHLVTDVPTARQLIALTS